MPPSVEAWSINCRTTREVVPLWVCLAQKLFCFSGLTQSPCLSKHLMFHSLILPQKLEEEYVSPYSSLLCHFKCIGDWTLRPWIRVPTACLIFLMYRLGRSVRRRQDTSAFLDKPPKHTFVPTNTSNSKKPKARFMYEWKWMKIYYNLHLCVCILLRHGK